jgi:TrmH family RNA methyltransferase
MRAANGTSPGANDSEVVDSLHHPRAIEIRRLLHESAADVRAPLLIDDESNIVQALRGGLTIEAAFWTGDETVGERLRQRLPAGVPVYRVAPRTCKKMFQNDKIARVFAIARSGAARTLEDLAGLDRDVVALEGVAIAGNAGAIVRTAAALSAGAVVLLDADPRFLRDRRFIRASRGHVFSLPVVTARTADILRFRDRHRWLLVAARPGAKRDVRDLSTIDDRVIVAFGGEKTGCSRPLLDAADAQVAIPIDPQVESLNVSVAAGIVLHCRFQVNGGGRRFAREPAAVDVKS